MRFDLVIKGGRVLDPGEGLDGDLDVAIDGGRIAAVERGIPAESAARTIDATGQVTLEAAREPFETKTDDRLVAALRTAGQRVGGETPEEIGLPLVGDASLYANELGLPCAYYGPGYETAHSDAERVSLDKVVHIAGVYALTMMEYCGVAADGGADAV